MNQSTLDLDLAMQFVKPALSTDPDREVLRHAAITRSGKEAYLVATDTHRLHVCRVDKSLGPKEGTRILNMDAGAYPNWERVLPKESTRILTVPAKALDLALKAMEGFAKDCANRVRLTWEPDQPLTVSCRNEELGEVCATIRHEPEESKNPGIAIAFNVKYLRDALKPALKQPSSPPAMQWVEFGMTENSRPVIIRAFGLGDAYRAIIMPMALA